MSLTLQQIFALNPTATIGDNDLLYLVQSPYTPGTDAAILGSSLKSLFVLSTAIVNTSHGGTGINSPAQHNLLIGNGAAPLTQLPPNAATGIPLISRGLLLDPDYGTARVPGGGTGGTSFTAYSVICAGTSSTNAFQNVVGVGNLGQILTSNGPASLPSWQNPAASGTVNPGLINEIAYYAAPGTAVSGLATANDGLLVTSNTGVPSILAGPGVTGQVLQSNAAAAPSFSTATYPSTTAINQILYSSSNNVVGQITTNINGLLTTNNTGVPTILAGPGSANHVLMSNAAAAPNWSVATYPSASGTSGKILRSDGTNNLYSTSTFADTYAINTILYAGTANTITGLATSASAILTTVASVPTWSTTLPNFTTGAITFSPTTGGIVGTTAADNAGAGKVGELVTSNIASASAVSCTTATPRNVTSISLSAGDWDIYGNVFLAVTASAVTLYVWTSTTSATVPDGSLISIAGGAAIGSHALTAPFLRVNVNTTTTVYLSCQATFGSGTVTACGSIFARRVR